MRRVRAVVLGLYFVGTILIDAALLGILIFVVARFNATNDMLNRIGVVAGVTIGSAIMAGLWGEVLGLWILAPQFALTGVLLVWLVGANPVQALIITVLFFGIKIALRLAMAYVMSPA